MAYTGKESDIITDEQMGVFSGYIRRPVPSQAGMVAQIFGEDGLDADTILALSLTKYQDTKVLVNIYLVKDPDGKIMKQGEQYPLISSFLGFVRRSMPKKDGMLAQFFTPNGEHADSVALLSKSEYQDCLVFVDVRGAAAVKAQEKLNAENMQNIDLHYAEKITKQQREENNKKEKQFKKMNETLAMSEFLYRIEVLSAIGHAEDFKQWLTDKQTCAHAQERPCMIESNVVNVPNIFKPFNYLPCCELHKADMNNEEHLAEHQTYYEMKHRLLAKQWAMEKLRQQFSFDGKGEPDPAKIIDWAASKNISKYLPLKYQAIL